MKLTINGKEVEKSEFALALGQDMDEVVLKFGPKGKNLISGAMGNPLSILGRMQELKENPVDFITEMHIVNNTVGQKTDS